MKKFYLLFLGLCLTATIAFAETEMQLTNRMMNECIQNNLCYKADAQMQRVYVNEYVWRTSAFDDKQNIAMFFMKYTKARNNRAVFVEIMSSSSGKKIGTYNSYNGYRE